MACPLCDDPEYPKPEDEQFLPSWRCAACGYEMDRDDRDVWNAAFGAQMSSSGRPGLALLRAGQAVFAQRQSQRGEAERPLPRKLERVANLFLEVREGGVAIYAARQQLLEELAGLQPVPVVRKLLALFPVDHLTSEVLDTFERMTLGKIAPRLHPKPEASLAPELMGIFEALAMLRGAVRMPEGFEGRKKRIESEREQLHMAIHAVENPSVWVRQGAATLERMGADELTVDAVDRLEFLIFGAEGARVCSRLEKEHAWSVFQ